ncbi:protealysin inhibitor emfourin [Actinoplanes sp. NPDC020271]|uniref:protealysin inhibitor emfourin n=1 Tax=Actinoplanes sp. NPDC020271 TaxID=3363896 RepID=UPI0037B1F968
MRVSLTTHGGLAAPIVRRLPPRVLDTDRLPDTDARELRRLVAAATENPGGARPGSRARDVMTYTITVDDGPHSVTLTSADTSMSPAFGALLTWVERRTAG